MGESILNGHNDYVNCPKKRREKLTKTGINREQLMSAMKSKDR